MMFMKRIKQQQLWCYQKLKYWIGPIWTITFAMIALLDFWVCFPKWIDGWTEGRKQTPPSTGSGGPWHQFLHGKHQSQSQQEPANGTGYCPANAVEEENDDDSSTSSYYHWLWSCFRQRGGLLTLWWFRLQWTHTIGTIFALLCIVESIRRARQARQSALDMAALDEFEKSLARFYSATKLSTVFRRPSWSTTTSSTSIIESTSRREMGNQPHRTNQEQQEDDEEARKDFAAIRRLIRVWTPVLSTLFGWCILLPWPILIQALLPKLVTMLWWSSVTQQPYQHFSCGEDPAMATVWITQSTSVVYETLVQWQEQIMEWLWKMALPVRLWMQPILLIQRLRLLSRWIRYLRYGGPLLRLLIKLNDQFWVFGKTWKQTWTVQTEKAKRLASRSMLFQDLQQLESLTKLQTRLASLPSQFQFMNSNYASVHAAAASTTTLPSLTRSKRNPNLLLEKTTTVPNMSRATTSSSSLSCMGETSPAATATNASALASASASAPSLSSSSQSPTPPHLMVDTTTSAINSSHHDPTATTPLASNATTAVTSSPSSFSSTSTTNNSTSTVVAPGTNPPTTTTTTPPATRPSVAVLIAKKQMESKRLQRRLNHLRQSVYQQPSSGAFSSSELYDRMMELTQEVSRSVHSAVWNQNLISPHTRFSVAWRLCVTLALLSELGRLVLSWQLSGTFDLRYRDLTQRLLGVCQTKSRPVRKLIGKMVRLPPNHPWLDTCRVSSPSSQFSLGIARMGEWAIDIIGFLDILVWFYTGELNDSGVVVPKPFFARCILPGTLTQMLDHPTVPQMIPNLLSHLAKASRAVGYSRVLRWGLALYPALDLLLFRPIHRYLFHPMDQEEYLNYTESLVHFPRRRQSFSSSHSLRNDVASHPRLLDRQHSSSSLNDLDQKRTSNSGDLMFNDDEPDYFDPDCPSFLRPRSTTRSNSFSNVFHASISENDGYGLYY